MHKKIEILKLSNYKINQGNSLTFSHKENNLGIFYLTSKE